MSDSSFDLIIIGAGPGGYVAAAHAARLGMRVACVDKSELGGTCLQVGCIPSKALLDSSELYHRASHGLEHHGIRFKGVELDLAAMMARKNQIVGTMTKGVGALFRQHKITHLSGTAHIPTVGQVAVTDKESVTTTYRAGRILLATGSTPIELADLPFDGRHVISSTEALFLDAPPARLVVVGAGAIGLELGSVWKRLGSDVLVVEYMDRILPGLDEEMTGQLQKLLKRQGLEFKFGTSAKELQIDQGKVQLRLDTDGKESIESCDLVLVAVGRRPNHTGLWAEDLAIGLDERGHIQVDADFQTGATGVYAIGDLIPGPMLAHKAEAEGVAAVERMCGKAGHVNYHAIPNVVYTHPELASVGLGEAEAAAQGHPVKTGKHLFRANARAHSMDATDGLVKLVSNAQTDRLLGMHILGPQASHLIAEGVAVLEFSGSAEDIARTIHAHPSLSEVIKEAAWNLQN